MSFKRIKSNRITKKKNAMLNTFFKTILKNQNKLPLEQEKETPDAVQHLPPQ